jgi:hypothetical protein
MRRTILTGLFLSGCFIQSFSQQTKELISTLKSNIHYNDVDTFYQLNNYSLYLYSYCNARNHLITLLSNADTYGLNEKDYQYSMMPMLGQGNFAATLHDSIEADVFLSDAALHFFKELQTGVTHHCSVIQNFPIRLRHWTSGF